MTDAILPDPKFADAFPAATEAQWRGLVDRVLKGAPFERLVAKTYDGIAIEPLYPRAREGSPRALRSEAGPWRVLTRIDHPAAEAANAAALVDLENGATGLQIVFAHAVGAHGFGVAEASRAAVETLFDRVLLETGVRIEFELSPLSHDVATHVADLVEARGIEPGLTDLAFGFDPMGVMAFSGHAPAEWKHLAATAAGHAIHLASRGFGRHFFAADGRTVHAAGGTEAQELAYAVASAVAYLRALEDVGVDLDKARDMVGFRLAADADEFLTLSKFRALRRLWSRIEEGCGLAPKPIHIHGETAWRMTTRRDPWVNLLRATVATFSAGLGGADSICVLPFTQALGLPDDFARRIARNTQLVLLEESNLGKVVDPAAGAGGFEALTQALCERAWVDFQTLEKGGGLAAALTSGAFQSSVADARAARARNVAKRRDAITGVSDFPNVHDADVHVLAPLAATYVMMPGAFAALTPVRDAEPFEALRDRADAMERSGDRPKVFLANLGPISAFNARATFAKNFYEAGGIEALSNDGFETSAELDEAFTRSGAPLACICSSDALYAERAAEAARMLAKAGAKRIYLAGRPGELEAALRDAGVGEFIFVGCDVLTVLQNAFSFAA